MASGYTIRTRGELDSEAMKPGNASTIFELQGRAASASRWTTGHLVPFRLIALPMKQHLPVLWRTHRQNCPSVDRKEVDVLCGRNPDRLTRRLESDLETVPGGPFWVALAGALRRAAQQEPEAPQSGRRMNPLRNARPSVVSGQLEYFVPSGEMRDDDGLDADESYEYDSYYAHTEDVAVALATRFLSFVLCRCLNQSGYMEVRVRIEPQDDGGICAMELQDKGWQMTFSRVAILEAKRGLGHVARDPATGEFQPVSTNLLPQCLGEAIIAWKSTPKEERNNDVFLLVIVNTFFRLIHFRFGSDYLEYLDAPDPRMQLSIALDQNKDSAVMMESSKWFNLEVPGHRKAAMCHVLALVRWFRIHSLRDRSAEKTESDSSDVSDTDIS
ncbi:hypothetical protein CCM_08731 [Cordyceps militaris CM01]|uniref:Uncharacterized protein n=1 Tax=Cordyceps militaris (strain CM01) TaxID=983644 RepID=G3JS39_CORMM|nr:uncharacterized protein CCM_08731 [Cordyceps militaris CM01]EGX88685.1 hypothetical protein CCM_08731 [Cordyceps militaris CM01]